MKDIQMQYVLTGFTRDLGYRVFTFDRVGEDRERTHFRVRADLALIRRYGIQIQDLPLLCRGLLERSDAGPAGRSITYTEAEMSACAADRAAARALAVSKRRSMPRPVSQNGGAAARVQHV